MNINKADQDAGWHSVLQAGEFDLKVYLFARYGSRMLKKDLHRERKWCRATIDNKRNPNHPSFDRLLADAEVKSCSGKVEFDTFKIAEMMLSEGGRVTG